MGRYICAWCKCYLNDIVYEGKDSHGICSECYKKFMKEMDELIEYNNKGGKNDLKGYRK